MISIIAAMSVNRVIGVNNTIPWHLPEDLKRFKEITMGYTVVMGRNTFESIGKPLSGRRNIVLSSNPDYHPEGVEVVHNISDIKDDVFIIGGSKVYKDFLPIVDKMYLTIIGHSVEGDVYFPEWDSDEFIEVSREERIHPFSFTFLILERKDVT